MAPPTAPPTHARLPPRSLPLQLARDVRLVCAAGASAPDAVALAEALTALGRAALVREALGGGRGQDCFRNLANVFVLVEDPASGEELIVEPRFREQFDIPHPTPRYAALLRAAPRAVALPAAPLRALVRLLGEEMRAAFAARGLSVPPWRQQTALASKWLPARARDFAIATPSPGGSRGASPPRRRAAPAASGGDSGADSPAWAAGGSPRAVLDRAAERLAAGGDADGRLSMLSAGLKTCAASAPPQGYDGARIRRVYMRGADAAPMLLA
jgi:uncharacterized protein (TIGR01615 family)